MRFRMGTKLVAACCFLAMSLTPLLLPQTGHAAGFKWTTPTASPLPLDRPAVALGHDGNVYVFGGTDGQRDYNTTYIYHPRSNAWTVGTTMPVGLEGAQAVTLPDGRIMVMGGGAGCHFTQDCTIYNSVEVYNPATSAWSMLAPMQTPRYRFGAALGSDGRVYAIGGWNGTSAVASVEAYSSTSNTWTYVAPLPQPEEALAAVSTHGAILVLGGMNGLSEYNNVFVLSGATWINAPPMLTARHDLAVAVGPFGAIYAVGGYSQNLNNYLATVEIFNDKSWSTGPALPQAMANLVGVTIPTAYGPYLYTFGGWNGFPNALVDAFGYFP